MRARLILLLLALVALAPPAVAQVKDRTPMTIVTALPAELAGFRRDGEPLDYETSRPGLGASVNYRRVGAPGLVTVYVYDGYAPPRRLTAGAQSAEVAWHMQSAGNDIVQGAQQRRTKVTGPVEAMPVPGPGGRPALRCQRFGLLPEAGDPAESHLCIGVVQGRLLKLRVTQPTAPMPRDAEVAAFGAAVFAALTGR
jgi:hypothetical protein